MSNVVRGTEQARALSKRKAILDAASKLMVAEGLRRVTHRQVAAEAGVPVGSIGYYYSSREKLIEVCFEDIHCRRLDIARRLVSEAEESATHDKVADDILAIATAGSPDALGGLICAAVDASREQRDKGKKRVKEQANEALEQIGALLKRSGCPRVSAREAVDVMIGAAVVGVQVGEVAHETARDALLRLFAGRC